MNGLRSPRRTHGQPQIGTTFHGFVAGVDGIDVDAVIAAIDTPEVEEEYQRDRAEARTAAGSPTQLQGKHATSDGPVRYTAPSLVFEHGGRFFTQPTCRATNH